MARGLEKKLEQKNILLLRKIPSTVTPSHIEKFFGTLVECYMKCNASGQYRSCYVYFHKSKTALKALKKDKKMLEDYIVRVELAPPSVTLKSLRKKETLLKLRLVPFRSTKDDREIVALVRTNYPSVMNVEVHGNMSCRTQKNANSLSIKYAILTFENKKLVEEALERHAQLYRNIKTPEVKKYPEVEKHDVKTPKVHSQNKKKTPKDKRKEQTPKPRTFDFDTFFDNCRLQLLLE